MALELKKADTITTVTDAELVPEGDKDTTYQVRHLTTEKHREIEKQNTKMVPNKRTHQREPELDADAFTEDLIDYIVAGWSGVVANGEPLPCTREYKLLLDAARKRALLVYAGSNEIVAAPERRAESFPDAAGVR